MAPYDNYIVYGPYSRRDGRSHMCLVDPVTGKRKTVSYPKYRMEIILNRYLLPNEEVHHRDENVSNNSDDNFELVDGTIHRKQHKTGTSKYQPEFWTCIHCGKQWLATSSQVRDRFHNVRKGKINGPYCSKQCSGIENN